MSVKVSVCMTTYNHEEFIAQAVESALMQEVSFDYEIIIGEDGSQDETRRICIDYAERYPDKIRLFLRSREDVIYVDGRPTGRFNLVESLRVARGKYIALCEGDDYWIAPDKLRKQVDFLESHPEFAICFHNVGIVYENSAEIAHPFYVENPDRPFTQRKPKPISTLEDLVRSNFIQTPSVMFRARLFESFPRWFYELDRGDWVLHVLNAQHGLIAYSDEVMAAYRVHARGIYSSKSRVEQLEGALRAASAIDRHLGYQYHEEISEANANRLLAIISKLEERGDLGQSRSYATKYVCQYGVADRRAMRVVIKAYSPRIWRLLERAKRFASHSIARHRDKRVAN
jgi:glycosyltransferase involved in cell wall biosynthesis